MPNQLLCTWVRMCRTEDNLLKLVLSFSRRGSRKSNAAKAWQSVPFPTEPSCLGTLIFRKKSGSLQLRKKIILRYHEVKDLTPSLSFKAEIWFAYQNHLNTVSSHVFAKFSSASPVTPHLHYPKPWPLLTVTFLSSTWPWRPTAVLLLWVCELWKLHTGAISFSGWVVAWHSFIFTVDAGMNSVQTWIFF